MGDPLRRGDSRGKGLYAAMQFGISIFQACLIHPKSHQVANQPSCTGCRICSALGSCRELIASVPNNDRLCSGSLGVLTRLGDREHVRNFP